MPDFQSSLRTQQAERLKKKKLSGCGWWALQSLILSLISFENVSLFVLQSVSRGPNQTQIQDPTVLNTVWIWNKAFLFILAMLVHTNLHFDLAISLFYYRRWPRNVLIPSMALSLLSNSFLERLFFDTMLINVSFFAFVIRHQQNVLEMRSWTWSWKHS